MKIIIIIIIFFITRRSIEKFKISKWYKKNIHEITEDQLDSIFIELVRHIKELDINQEDYKFDVYNLPYGRVNAFLNYFGRSIRDEEVYYYSPIKSMNYTEIREYGLCIGRSGIYFAKQYKSKDGKNAYYDRLEYIPFKAMSSMTMNSNIFEIDYIDISNKKHEIKRISKEVSSLPSEAIVNLNNSLIEKDIPLIYLKEKIISDENIGLSTEEAEKKFILNLNKRGIVNTVNIAGVMSSGDSMMNSFNENKNYMNGSRGGGYAAEYGNNTIDRLLGRDVVNQAQNLDDSGRQIKSGADRIVSGEVIQTKYYKTASESIGSAFENGRSIYNENGEMMQIEVPKDQYQRALELMKNRIDSGQVEGARPGDDPSKYVRKGHFTYMQANNIAIAGTVESLTVDMINGAVVCTQAGGISAIIAFSIALWNGHSFEDAAKVGLTTGMKVIGKGTLIYTLSMQLYRDKIVNPFAQKIFTADGIAKSANYVSNPIFEVTNNLANSIQTSDMAKTEFGKIIGLDQMTGKTLVASGVTVAIVFGPDLCRALTGRISKAQLFKNSAVGIAGMGGSLLGQAMIPVPVLGAMIGGALAGYAAKKTLDNFIEDDAIEMFQILKEEFLDVVMVSDLTESEFEIVVTETISNKKLSKLLMDMYQSKDYRNFARNVIVTVAVTKVLSNRRKVKNEDIYKSYGKLVEQII